MTSDLTPHVRLLLVDDHEVVLHGLRALLSDAPEVRVVAEAHNGAEALALHEAHRPDVTLMDIRMPGIDGIEVLRQLRRRSRDTRVIMLAADGYQSDILRAWQHGAAGFLLKTTSRPHLLDAIRHAHQHGWCAPFEPGFQPQGADGTDVLSSREMEVLDYVSRGLSNGDIALALGITEHTIKAHMKAVFYKLGCADRTEAVVAAFERGLLRVSPFQTDVAQTSK
jgi:DNA-binding NarL/FixJ family response regulator